ncbi:unnamed protein product [Acanthoscelides obtectus]|uniref:Uncharacterized protein n=1 Tax=Acanthoscelides obtectus TaxID=200917 RepID=A0A9P0P4N2_ACAOB|nr:unnamed protein product [Acanthoscelides obtectus]CAK1627495.1 hypothetical protein AOBTE_LOCUS4630 [Acanthoscelides obtectus]
MSKKLLLINSNVTLDGLHNELENFISNWDSLKLNIQDQHSLHFKTEGGATEESEKVLGCNEGNSQCKSCKNCALCCYFIIFNL